MEKFIKHIKSIGREFTLPVIDPFLANDSEKVWFLLDGELNISSTIVKDGQPYGRLNNFLNIQPGEFVFGIKEEETTGLSFLVDANVESKLVEISLSEIKSHAKEGEFLDFYLKKVNKWISRLYKGVKEDTTVAIPVINDSFIVGTCICLNDKRPFDANSQTVVIKSEIGNKILFNNHISLKVNHCFFPVAENFYLTFDEGFKGEVISLREAYINELIWEGIEELGACVLASDLYEKNIEESKEAKRLENKYRNQDIKFISSLSQIKSVFKPKDSFKLDFKTNDHFFNACQLVASSDDIKLKQPDSYPSKVDKIAEICRYSGIRYREVLLEGNWLKENNEDAFLAFYGPEKEPVAVIPKNEKLHCINPNTEAIFEINDENKGQFQQEVYNFFKPFSDTKKLSITDIFLFSFSKNKKDLVSLLLMGFLGSTFGLLTPILSAQIFDSVIPNADKYQLYFIAIALFAMALGAMSFDMVKSFALLRVQGRMDFKLQSALWDRLLNLPSDFFKKYSVGDLASRSMGINSIREILSGTVIVSILSGVFSMVNLGLLLYYSVNLALLAILISLVQVGALLYFTKKQMVKQKILMQQQGTLSGLVFQILNGIPKYRSAGAENTAFLKWFQAYMETKGTTISHLKLQNSQRIFSGVFSIASTIFVYLTVTHLENSLSTGEFIAFIAAYGAFVAAIVGLGNSFMTAQQIPLIYDRLEPILAEKTEADATKDPPDNLKGGLEFQNVSFRYSSDGPLIISNLSLSIKSGEYVALVGPSGSGKSTLIRLLLGFNSPEAGSIYFDDQDLSQVDVRLIRKQLGVVLQDGSLLSGDIYTNIVGSAVNLTYQDAWAAARAAAFDRDIRTMPMGMHTIVNEDGGTLSGGQKQRLMIARALVHNPKILIFDEATSALDNETQAIVTKSLDQLHVTRIVIAHRLSTIINADTIYYLEGGKLIESGSYQELMDLGGKFYELAARQIE